MTSNAGVAAGDGRKRVQRVWLLLVTIVTAALFWRVLALIEVHAVDLLVQDQWDIYGALMEPRSAWELFRWQHSPIRQGLGTLMVAPILDWTRWDVRSLSYLAAAILLLCSIVACVIKRKLFGRWHVTDAAIPLIVLTTSQWFTITAVVNPSHGLLPTLFVLLSALVWIGTSGLVRAGFLSAVMFVSAQTGFAIFLVPVLAAVYALRWRRGDATGRRSVAVVSIAAAASLIAFLIGWLPRTASGCFSPFGTDLFFIPTFAFIMFARFVGASFHQVGLVASAVGAALVLVILVVCARAARARWRGEDDPGADVMAILLGFSLLFAASAAYGRVCLTAMSAEQSRYMTLLVPAFLALYFASLRSNRVALRIVLVVAVALGSLPIGLGSSHPAAGRSGGAARWRACYLATRSIEGCADSARFTIYPTPANTRMKEKMDYLEKRRLSLFREHGSESTGVPPLAP